MNDAREQLIEKVAVALGGSSHDAVIAFDALLAEPTLLIEAMGGEREYRALDGRGNEPSSSWIERPETLAEALRLVATCEKRHAKYAPFAVQSRTVTPWLPVEGEE